jgi:hypothetical protein
MRLWLLALALAVPAAAAGAESAIAGELDCPRPAGSTCWRYDAPLRPVDTSTRPNVALEIFNTTYAYNVESQGTFAQRRFGCNGPFCGRNEEEINGFTLFGDFTGVQVRYSPSEKLNLYGGVFFAIPFGGEDTISQISPIISLHYRPIEGVSLIAGTLQTRHPFHDAVFDDLMYFVRPIEQGGQFLVNREHYVQDLFINWYRQNTRVTNERFDVGYIGKLKFGPARFNLQYHWDHAGGEIPFPDFRPIEVRNNTTWAAGPELAFATPVARWPIWEEVGVAFTFLGDRDQPNSLTPELTNQGHAHELKGWVTVDGWNLSVARWKGDNFFASNGDRFFGVRNMTELHLAKFFDIHRQATIEFGGWVRFIDQKSTDPATAAGSGSAPVNIFYVAVHWNFDVGLDRYVWPGPAEPPKP